jgi:CheY-like chemotaxis protein
VVDDGPVSRALIVQALAPEFDTVVVTDTEDALEACERRLFNVVLLDLRRPSVDGAAFVSRYQTRYGPAAGPILVLSASQPPASLTDQVAGLIGKPFVVEELVGTVRALARRRISPR